MSATKPSAVSEQRRACLSLHAAIRAGDITAVMSSVKDGAAVNDVDQEHSFTALHWAAQEGRLECLHWLLWQGADSSCRTPQGWTPAHLAAIRGQRACLEALIVNGVDLSVQDQRGCTPAHLAAAHGHPDTLQTILRTGADPDRAAVSGWSPIHYAAFHGRLGCLQILAKWGSSVETTDKDGNIPAHLAAAEGHVLCLKFLALKGGSLDRTLKARNNHGESPQDLASRFNKHPVLECIEDLYEHADVPQEMDALEFPGHTAAFHGDLDTLRKLLECGVININDRDEEGSTLLDRVTSPAFNGFWRWERIIMPGTAQGRHLETPLRGLKYDIPVFAQLAAVKVLGQEGSDDEDKDEVSEGKPLTAAQGRQARERAFQRLEELRQQVEIAQSNYRQLGGELQDTDQTDTERQAQSALQDLQTELEIERERRERLETQLDNHRAQIRKLQEALRSVQVSKDAVTPCTPIIEKKKTSQKRKN